MKYFFHILLIQDLERVELSNSGIFHSAGGGLRQNGSFHVLDPPCTLNANHSSILFTYCMSDSSWLVSYSTDEALRSNGPLLLLPGQPTIKKMRFNANIIRSQNKYISQ